MKRLSTDELQDLMQKHEDLVMLNVVDPKAFEKAHIPGSINVHAMEKDFVQRVEETLNGEQMPIVVYATNEYSGLSKTGAKRLENAGFERVYEYPGGTEAWAEDDQEIEGSLEVKEDEEEASAEEKTESKEEKKQTKESDGEAKQKKDKEKPAKKSKKKSDKSKSSNGKIRREAAARWTGSLKEGSGSMKLGSAEDVDLPYSFGSRFESEEMTNPEELLGAAHAGCFSMALAGLLAEAGKEATAIETSAKVSLEKQDGDFRITAIELSVTGEVDGLEEKEFEEMAEEAAENCPVSAALSGAKITVKARMD